jgi:hypothetical protein
MYPCTRPPGSEAGDSAMYPLHHSHSQLSARLGGSIVRRCGVSAMCPRQFRCQAASCRSVTSTDSALAEYRPAHLQQPGYRKSAASTSDSVVITVHSARRILTPVSLERCR